MFRKFFSIADISAVLTTNQVARRVVAGVALVAVAVAVVSVAISLGSAGHMWSLASGMAWGK